MNAFGKHVRCEVPPHPAGGLNHGGVVADALNEPWRATGKPIFERLGSEQIHGEEDWPDDGPRHYPMTVQALGLPSPWRGVHAIADLCRIAAGGDASAPEGPMVF